MQQDQNTRPQMYDDEEEDDEAAIDRPADVQKHSNDSPNLRGSEREDIDFPFNEGNTGTDDDDGMPEDQLLALRKWASRLCLVCRKFLQATSYGADRYEPSKAYTYHSSLNSLGQSVEAGCPLCRKLSSGMDGFCRAHKLETTNDSLSLMCKVNMPHKGFFGIEGVGLTFYLVDDMGGHNQFRTLDFYPARRLDGLGPEFFDHTVTTSTAKSEATMKLIRSWYQQCTCRERQLDSRVLPTRLIQIWRPHQGFPDICARLCDTKHLPATALYVTLSHRWGPNAFLMLQKSNRREFQRGIPVHQLVTVFKDAMHIALELGIQYIWIDSLCIIQDCTKDWAYESRRMGAVYQYGEFNIAATGYENGDSGLFCERDAVPSRHIPVYLDCEHPCYGSPTTFKGHYIQINDSEFIETMIGLLNHRAWVAQERALSPAVIHFTPQETWWECGDLIASETLPDHGVDWDYDELYTPWQIRSLDVTNREEMYAYWRRFVDYYCFMQMTFEKDRFPAATGVARILGRMLNENFIAGVWEGDIARSLVWRPDQLFRFSSPRVAPSWSWASVHGIISGLVFDSDSCPQPLSCIDIKALFEIDGVSSDLDTGNLERSEVRALSVRGPLRRLLNESGVTPGKGMEGVRYWPHEDIRSWDGVVESESIPEEHAWRLNGSTHLLALVKDVILSSRVDVYGILLQRVPEAQDRNTFRRCGSVQFRFRDEKMPDEFLGIVKKDGEYQPSLGFEECGVQDVILI